MNIAVTNMTDDFTQTVAIMKKLSAYLLAVGIGVSAYVLSEVSGNAADAPSSTKLNVVFFLVDDLGWADLGYEGSTLYRTPNIDSFAKRGVRFSNAYSTCPVCSPSRASILTGEYPARLHLTDWLPGRKNFPFQKLKNAVTVQHLPYAQPTLPQVLKENGYRTAIFGKWHLGEEKDSTQRQGFDLHIPDWNRGWPNETYFSPYGMKGLEGGPNGEYLTDRLTTQALKWVETNKDQPFFLYLAHFAVHDPIMGRRDLVAKYEHELNHVRHPIGPPYILEGNPDDANPLSPEKLKSLLEQDKRYDAFGLLPQRTVKIKENQDNPQFAAMVESMDESLGRVRAKLKELNLDDKTIVILFSDNGGMSAANLGNPQKSISKSKLDKQYSTSNLPLRGGKGWLYEGGIREPLIIYWPHAANNGAICDTPVIGTDFYATILDMLKLQPKQTADDGTDGISLVPLLKAEKEAVDKMANRAIYWHWPHYSNHGAQSPGGAVRVGNYKLIEYYENNTVQLFDLQKDPGEQHDLSHSAQDKTHELTAMLHAWRKSVNAEMPDPNPDYDAAKKWPVSKLRDEP
ncbi:MAG: sulfatase [Limisphaerales bacterium]